MEIINPSDMKNFAAKTRLLPRTKRCNDAELPWEKSCYLKADILVVAGTAIATVTSGLVSVPHLFEKYLSPLPDIAFPAKSTATYNEGR